MTIAVRPESRAKVQPAWGAILNPEHLLPAVRAHEHESRLPLSTTELAFRIFAAFRAHPHVNNVLTHISRAKLVEVERSLNRIVDPSTTVDALSPLEENIIELMVGERGITGKILKPYLQAVLYRILEPDGAERLIRHINALYLELEWKVQHPPPAPLSNEHSREAGHAGDEP
jgi:hypothetical protein